MKTLTVVDDDSDLRNLLQIALSSEGFEVQVFGSGHEMINAFHSSKSSDLYVVDLNLGGISGGEVCNYIKTHTPSSLVILISANPDLPQTAIESKADGYLFKPFTQRELISKIKMFLL
jgi:DNA-binding response OmpR family regulator